MQQSSDSIESAPTLPQENEPHQSEASLQQALDLAQSVAETVRQPLLVLDDALRVRMANRAFYRTFAAEKSQIENRLLHELGAGEWDEPELQNSLREVLTSDTSLEDFELEQNFCGIGRKTMLLNARCLAQQQHGGRQILIAMEDITERKRAQQEIQAYIKRLEWSNRELQDFAYIASHDLQEPLRAIQAFGERLKAKNADAFTDEGRDHLERMQQAAGRMRVLIHDLLAFSRVTTKAKPFSEVDLAAVVRSAVSDLMKRLEETDGHVEIGDLPTLVGDATQMRQLFQNLIANALKFHRSDVPPAVKIYCDSNLETATQNGEETPGVYRIVVQDNGIGFDQKYAERIFTPFQRLHSQRQYEGTGIGLAICRKIVERHHGSISAQSTLGQGAQFVITLPVEPPLQWISS